MMMMMIRRAGEMERRDGQSRGRGGVGKGEGRTEANGGGGCALAVATREGKEHYLRMNDTHK